jgi:hypothetical protein
MTEVDPAAIRRHLEQLLSSDPLGKSEASQRLLSYLVERALQNTTPKEAEIAIDVFGKGASFNGAEDSAVRVAVRTLRQKLAECYATAGSGDGLQFVIPKGGYRLTVRTDTPSPAADRDPASDKRARPRGSYWTSALAALLVLSALGNVWLWYRGHSRSPSAESMPNSVRMRVRASPVWGDLIASRRPLTLVLGDLFMFTQVDPQTGRTLTVRDSLINSSEELRAFLASNPLFAAARGQRYVSVIQKTAAIGMADVLQIVDQPDRHMEVTVRDDLQADEVRDNDIIYVGPLTGLGLLSGYYQARSRYRVEASDSALTDLDRHTTFVARGTLGAEREDYAIVAKFLGPSGNHIMVITSGVRNAGVLQIVRTVTSPEGLSRLEAQLSAHPGIHADSFEALLKVTGFRQADLSAEVIAVDSLPSSPRPDALKQAAPSANAVSVLRGSSTQTRSQTVSADGKVAARDSPR